MTGFVYFARCGDFVKIGHSWCPEDRIRYIAVASPYPVELLAKFAGTLLDERHVHYFLREHRHRGEWFRWCPAIQEIVRSGLPARQAIFGCLEPTAAFAS